MNKRDRKLNEADSKADSEARPVDGGIFRDLVVGNLGTRLFADSIAAQGREVRHIDWQVPCRGDEQAFSILEALEAGEIDVHGVKTPLRDFIDAANRKALEAIKASHPFLVGIGVALRDIPGMREDMMLHAGPPVAWDRMCGPMKGAIVGALMLEGRARTPEEAQRVAASGNIVFEPCHHHNAVGPMAGVVSPSMPVWIVENREAGTRAFCTLNEGLGKVLRFGAYGEEVIGRLRWMNRVLAPILGRALEIHGDVDLRSMIAQALQMGDEGHNRNRAGTSLLIRELAPAIARAEAGNADKAGVLEFMHRNDHFFLNLTMPAAKCSMDAASGIKGSSLVSVMARNGTDFGIRVSGLGNRWFTAAAPVVKGLYFPGYGEADGNPDIGDSTICETYGIGGLAMAAAPAIVEFVGGSPSDALGVTQRMYSITVGESPSYRIPALGFRGTPTGIDIVKVVERGDVPAVNTGIAHRLSGIGQIGAGLVEPPMECFVAALDALLGDMESYAR